ncbi:MAG TPA: VTT domain-containing protein [Pyrinomonadaceae bacterium]|nr:VTT domain-containing protein [Pyrinomonadaceae bacterium]
MENNVSITTKLIRKILIVIWISIVVVCISSYFANPTAFQAGNIAYFLEKFGTWIWAVYLAFSIIRGFTLLPSTPLVIAGTLIFPDQPFWVLVVSMTGILLSSTMIYYFSELLGFDEYFEKKSPETVHKINAKLEHPLGFLFVAGWAFFPFVPTDLVCYLAGTTRMNFAKFIAAIFVGELTLCYCYVYLGGSLIDKLI